MASLEFEPEVGDEVIVIGQDGIYCIIEIDHDIHTVAVKNKTTSDLLNYIPWNALKYATIKLA